MIVRRRIYTTNERGRRVLVARPGDSISDEELERIEAMSNAQPVNSPRRVDLLGRLHKATVPAPTAAAPKPAAAKPLDRMKLDELRAVCEAEKIDPGDAITRAEHIAKIEAARAFRAARSDKQAKQKGTT